MTNRGQYVVIEGTDATGKTTVAAEIANRLIASGKQVMRVDEPDSAHDANDRPLVPIASELRRLIKDGSIERSATTNLLLFTASRYENWIQAIKPALQQGIWVIGARNWLSTLAFQGYGEGFDKTVIERYTLELLGKEYMNPDHLFILDIQDETERARRLSERGPLEKPDTFEMRQDDFQAKVRQGYRVIAKQFNIPIISADQTKEQVANEIWSKLLIRT